MGFHEKSRGTGSIFNGKKIYLGGSIEGNLYHIFWSDEYMPEHLRTYCQNAVEGSMAYAKDLNLHPNHCLRELEYLFLSKATYVLYRMAGICAVLLGNGHQIPPKKDITFDGPCTRVTRPPPTI